jgi:transposase
MCFGPEWSRLFPSSHGLTDASIVDNPARDASRFPPDRSFPPSFMCCVRAASGRLCRVNSVVPARFTHTFNDGNALAFFSACGRQDSPNTTRWRASPGAGKASMGPCIRLLWQPNAWGRTPRIGEKNGRKRSLLVDARGVPLSLVASGANRHDVKLLEATLRRIVCPRPQPNPALPQSLCMDAGYVGYKALVTTRKLGYQHNLQSRRQESESKSRIPGHIARRWVVERTHSWFNRFRKLLVSFEKKEESYLALLSLAAAMICWRQTISIYG